ncbi:GspH/FimT family pseudopilin [Ralstonia pickettii]|uniref:GspH/FimT family pseudopilin n=1 Tax=Ralstonia pickettii TaxID=329 RepID=UPI0027144E46|nr:GspH/FimT family pseudopilin [Ralstonia pickettii]WKZ85996.1 GspH/FimT family pseudopilin [Ralstonia pickettii]
MGTEARCRGFTLIELLVTISVFAFLMLLAAPSFTSWIQDAQVRTAAESLQNGLRVAQAEAARRHRQVAMVLTNGVPNPGVTAQANGKNWFVTVIPNTTAGESYPTPPAPSPLMVQSGTLGAVAPNAQINGQAAVCFNSLGRLTTLNDGTYSCTIPATGTVIYAVTNSRSATARALNVTVGLGGSIRVCDPKKSLSQNSPDACS